MLTLSGATNRERRAFSAGFVGLSRTWTATLGREHQRFCRCSICQTASRKGFAGLSRSDQPSHVHRWRQRRERCLRIRHRWTDSRLEGRVVRYDQPDNAFGRLSDTPIQDVEWVEASGSLMVMLATHPPADCGEGNEKSMSSDSCQKHGPVVEFNLDPTAQGAGCYSV